MKAKLFFLIIVCFLFHAEKISAEHVYLTWKKDPQTTMVVQWISRDPKDGADLFFRKEKDNTQWRALAGSHLAMPEREGLFIHHVELTGLSPGSSYLFRITPSGKIYKFRTLPSSLERPLRVVFGGDIYPDDIRYPEEIHKIAAKMNPDVAILGGDLAYDAASKSGRVKPKAVDRWLKWINLWNEKMITQEGYLVPILPAIGNHETRGFFGQNRDQAPFFYALFPFPGREGYNVFDLNASMSVFILDSGHTHPIPGEQTAWLAKALEVRNSKSWKLAVYHVPAYPSVRPFDGATNAAIRTHWVPLFEKYGLTVAFEHHDHAYKRTHPILKGAKNAGGVTYMGDGAWGVKRPRPPAKLQHRWYLAQSLPERHFIFGEISQSEMLLKAINHKGKLIDSCKFVLRASIPPTE